MLEDIKLLKGISALFNYFIKFASINVIISASSAAVSIFFATFMTQDIFKEYFIGISLVLVLSNILPLGLIGAITVYKAHINNTQHISLLKLTLATILTLGVVAVIVSFLWSQGDYKKTATLLPIISYAVCYCHILGLVTYFQVTDKFKKATVLVVVAQSSIFGVLVVWNLLDLTLYYYFLFATVAQGAAIICCTPIALWRSLMRVGIFPGELKRILRFAIPSGLQSAIVSFILVGDRFLAERYLLESSTITYLQCALAASYIMFIINNYSNALGLLFVDRWRDLSGSEYKGFYDAGKRKTLYVLLLVLPYMPVTILFSYMLDVDSQWEFLILTNMLTFIYCINGATKFYLGALSMLERSDIILMAVIVSLCSLLVTFFLGRDLGLYSLVLAVFTANIMFFFIASAFSNFYMKQLDSVI